MTQSKKYAVTGGIGSGKSTVLGIIGELGYPVLSCDDIAHALLEQPAYAAGLARLFPAAARGEGIDREALSSLVFSDPQALRALDAYSHPRIMEELFRRMEGFSVSFAEVPLLYEEGLEGAFDSVIAVRRNEDARLRAAAERDGTDPAEIARRAANQLDPALLDGRGCIVVENDGPPEELGEKVRAALEALGVPKIGL